MPTYKGFRGLRGQKTCIQSQPWCQQPETPGPLCRVSRDLWGQGEPSARVGSHAGEGLRTVAGEAQVVETLRVLKGAGLTQGGYQPAVMVLGGHAGP